MVCIIGIDIYLVAVWITTMNMLYIYHIFMYNCRTWSRDTKTNSNTSTLHKISSNIKLALSSNSLLFLFFSSEINILLLVFLYWPRFENRPRTGCTPWYFWPKRITKLCALFYHCVKWEIQLCSPHCSGCRVADPTIHFKHWQLGFISSSDWSEPFITEMDNSIAALQPALLHCRISRSDTLEDWQHCSDFIQEQNKSVGWSHSQTLMSSIIFSTY